MLGLEGGSRFSKGVEALYRRQIQEASILVLQRSAALGARPAAVLRAALEKISRAPQLDLGPDEAALEHWWEALGARPALGISASDDPALAEADRALATLSCVVKLSSVRYFDGNKVLLEIASLIQTLLGQEAVELAHLKSVLSSIDGPGEHAAASALASNAAPDLINSLNEPIQLARMILNLRAEGDPEVLHSVVNRALFAVVEKSPDLFARMEHSEHFRPDAALALR
jgi:hypothetical protein